MSGGSRLDPWVDSYAARARGMTASEIRALFAVASRPEVVSLAGGMPFVSALPLDTLAETAARLVRDRGAEVLQYGSGQGDATLRSQILEVMSEVGITAHPDDVIVTTGSQMALDLVTRVFCDPGDVVLVEAPSYVGALGVFRAYECDVVHVAMIKHLATLQMLKPQQPKHQLKLQPRQLKAQANNYVDASSC